MNEKDMTFDIGMKRRLFRLGRDVVGVITQRWRERNGSTEWYVLTNPKTGYDICRASADEIVAYTEEILNDEK